MNDLHTIRVTGDVFGDTLLVVEEVDGWLIAEGCVRVAPVEALHAKGFAHASDTSLWPGGVVPYVIEDGFSPSARGDIVRAIEHVEERCGGVVFDERHSERDHVIFSKTTSNSCTSAIGRQKGGQQITVGPRCGESQIIHEIGHALALKHEHTRPDRDGYVEVLKENIQDGKGHNFTKSSGRIVGDPAFDYRSIMLYDSFAFSKNGRPTLQSITAGKINPSPGLSAGDVAALDELYPAAAPPVDPPEIEPPPLSEVLELHEGRFRCRCAWEVGEDSGPGLWIPAPGAPGTDANGVACFYDPGNWELILSVVRNGDWYAVMIAAATYERWSVAVEDTSSGEVAGWSHGGGYASPAVIQMEAFVA